MRGGSMAGGYWNGLIHAAMQPRAALCRQSRGSARHGGAWRIGYLMVSVAGFPH
jgi:hypothetical protein